MEVACEGNPRGRGGSEHVREEGGAGLYERTVRFMQSSACHVACLFRAAAALLGGRGVGLGPWACLAYRQRTWAP